MAPCFVDPFPSAASCDTRCFTPSASVVAGSDKTPATTIAPINNLQTYGRSLAVSRSHLLGDLTRSQNCISVWCLPASGRFDRSDSGAGHKAGRPYRHRVRGPLPPHWLPNSDASSRACQPLHIPRLRPLCANLRPALPRTQSSISLLSLLPFFCVFPLRLGHKNIDLSFLYRSDFNLLPVYL
ncbi:hypothetical protein OE88DRAFT_392425 [Heliocybe sulcata]|uniref:Uncharacterized protein n=1 Tax=Heliocybe sulcata TaxID=5364 RepID=A0A5C3MXY9_9AGAM|nr:hypothetical protein OE88DRAFT_392425 [Heliocybe sulcata]